MFLLPQSFVDFERVLEMTDGFGADYTFEATGNVKVMRQAVEAARMGWGLCTIAGVAGKGEVLEVVPRYLITGRRIAGASFGGAKGRDRVPELNNSVAQVMATERLLAKNKERLEEQVVDLDSKIKAAIKADARPAG